MKFLNNVEIDGTLTVGGTNVKNQLSTLQTNINTVSNTVNTVSANANKIKTYVGSDGKLHFTNASGADTALNFSNSRVYEPSKIKIVSMTKTSTNREHSNTGPISLLYDGNVVQNPALNSKELMLTTAYVTIGGTTSFSVTVDKPFYLSFIRTPYTNNYGVYNPKQFIIGDYTSPSMTRQTSGWTIIPYAPTTDSIRGFELGTTFNITLKTGGSSDNWVGMSELEIYGFYK